MTLLTRETVAFLTGLRANNDRTWFAAHEADYRAHLKIAGEAFAAALAEVLEAMTKEVHRYRIFRIHRDLRFSKDKTPYNAHLHISLSPDGGCSEGGPAWMFALEPDRLTLGAGIFKFSKAQLATWRRRVAAGEGEAVARMLGGLEAPSIRIPEAELKRVPAPFASDHPHAPLLRRTGLTAWIDSGGTDAALGADGPAYCARELLRLRGLFDLLRGL